MICFVCLGNITGERYVVGSNKTKKTYVMHRTHFNSIVEAVNYVRSKENL